MKRINYESDFVARMKLPEGMEGADFAAEFSTSGRARYNVSRLAGVLKNCTEQEDGSIVAVFKNHGLGVGSLKMKFSSFIPNNVMPDDIQKLVTPKIQDVELVAKAGDDFGEIEFNIAVDYAVIDAYDMAVKAGYKGTREEYIKMISSKPKSSTGNVLHRKSISYNSPSGEIYSYGAMRFVLRVGINKFDISKFEDNIFRDENGKVYFKIGQTSQLVIYSYDNNYNGDYLLASIDGGVLTVDSPNFGGAGLLRLKNGYNFFKEDRSLGIADLKTIICGKLAFPFDLSTINRQFLKLKFERLQRIYNIAFCLTSVVFDYYGTEIELDYEVRKKMSYNRFQGKAVRRKRWVRRSITNHPPVLFSPLGIIIGRSLRVSISEDNLFSFDLRIRLANHRHTSVSDWVYLNVRLRDHSVYGLNYAIMWA